MKIIFLDFDGVLNSHEWMEKTQKIHEMDHGWMHSIVDEEAAKRVKRIANATNAVIVVSSTWRRFHSINKLQQILIDAGCDTPVIGRTPILNSFRGNEIAQWLNENGPVEAFVILDDDCDMVHLNHKLVRTSTTRGLQDEHVELAIAQLGGRSED